MEKAFFLSCLEPPQFLKSRILSVNQDQNALSAEANTASSQVAWLGQGVGGVPAFSPHLLQLTEQRWACVPGVFCQKILLIPIHTCG